MNASELRALSPDASGRGAASGNDALAPLPETYYNRPLLKKPHWEWEVIAYLFMGGVMGGAGIIAALTNDETDPDLGRSTRYLAFALAATCPLVLIKHLGRPERFHHMLRIFKWRSAMSMGVWGLIAFSGPATLSALGQAARDGVLPRGLRHVAPRALMDPLMAVTGAFIGGYTGVLLSATAIPVWGIGKRHIPAFSLCSGVAGACAANALILALTGGSKQSIAKVERFELVASMAELTILTHFKRHAGDIGKPMFGGARGAKLTRVTEIGGIVIPALLGVFPLHARWKTALASALTLAGGYILRETLIEGGKNSSEDPARGVAAARMNDTLARARPSEHAHVVTFDGTTRTEREDRVAGEEPLEIRVRAGGVTTTIAITMRTPGNDFELAAGFLFGEGVIANIADIREMTYCLDGIGGCGPAVQHRQRRSRARDAAGPTARSNGTSPPRARAACAAARRSRGYANAA